MTVYALRICWTDFVRSEYASHLLPGIQNAGKRLDSLVFDENSLRAFIWRVNEAGNRTSRGWPIAPGWHQILLLLCLCCAKGSFQWLIEDLL